MPELSVVIPTFNRAGYCRDLLNILKQSGVPDLEVVVVNDGSSDDTEAVVRATDPQAIYISQRNSGPAAARNNGFRHSKGCFVAFLDCDDEWQPGKPAQALRHLQAHPEIDALFTDAQVGNPRDGFQSLLASQKPFFELPAKRAVDGFRILDPKPFFEWMLYRNAIFLGSMIVKREVFEAVGPFDETLCGAADWNLCLRLAHRHTFGFWNDSLAVYAKHEGGMSNDTDGMCREFCMALKNLRNQSPLDRSERRLVDKHLRHHMFGYAYRAYDRGDYREAKTRFAELLKTLPEARAFAYWSFTNLPGGVARMLRGAKRKADGDSEPLPQPEQEVLVKAVFGK